MPRHTSRSLVVLALVALLLGLAASPQPAVAITAPPDGALPGGVAGRDYSLMFAASDATGTVSYAVTAGGLPPGMTLDPSGLISGTPTATGTFNFRITDTDSDGGTATSLHSITVVCQPNGFSAEVDAGVVGAAYHDDVTFNGSPATGMTYVWASEAPPGLTMTDSVLDGTPTGGGTFSLWVDYTDVYGCAYSANYLLAVAAPTVAIAPSTLGSGTVGVAYSQELTASGGTAPHELVISDGDLPPGLTFDNGTLAGTPTTAGTYDFTVTATDSSTGTGPYSVTRDYEVVIDAPEIVVGPTVLDSTARAGEPYAATLSASGGTGSHTFDVSAGDLPPGLDLSETGGLSGTPTTPGDYRFTVTATDSSPSPYTGSREYFISVAPAWAAPTVTQDPADVSIAPGTDVELHAAATGNPEPTVRWQVETGSDWVDVPGATDRTLTLPAVAASHRYRAVFSGYGGASATTRAASVTVVTVVTPPIVTPVSTAPVVTGNPHARTVRAGKNVVFTATATGTPAPMIRWQVRIKGHWKSVKGATRSSLVLKKVRRGWDRRAYRAVFTNAAGSATTRAAVLKVRSAR